MRQWSEVSRVELQHREVTLSSGRVQAHCGVVSAHVAAPWLPHSAFKHLHLGRNHALVRRRRALKVFRDKDEKKDGQS